jgi:hypothetical protein
MLRRVVLWKLTDVSRVRTASIVKVMSGHPGDVGNNINIIFPFYINRIIYLLSEYGKSRTSVLSRVWSSPDFAPGTFPLSAGKKGSLSSRLLCRAL